MSASNAQSGKKWYEINYFLRITTANYYFWYAVFIYNYGAREMTKT